MMGEGVVTAYLFEARSIQSYILDSGRLVDMVGASGIVDSLCQKPLNDVLEKFGLAERTDVKFSRRAGGAFCALFPDKSKAEKLMKLWGLFVLHYAPGLEFVHVLSSGGNDCLAAKAGYAALTVARNRQSANLPEASPMARRSPRTGLPAVKTLLDAGGSEWADSPTVRKRAFSRSDALGNKFYRGAKWPRNLEYEPQDQNCIPFPFLEGNRYIGMIHADGNGMGKVLLKLQEAVKPEPEKYQELYREFSDLIEEATIAASQDATKKVLLPETREVDGKSVMPARPLVLGGDDLNIIVRGDLALDFVAAFCIAFEARTEEKLADLKKKVPSIPEKLTACAGVAFVKSSQPFYLAFDLAEQLCQEAKKQSGEHVPNGGIKPSSVVFQRVTTSFVDNYDTALERYLAIDETHFLTLGAYSLGEAVQGLPAYQALKDLKEQLNSEDMARGQARRLLMILHQNNKNAAQHYARWREVMGASKTLAEFDKALKAVGETIVDKWSIDKSPFLELGANHQATPLGDAMCLMAVEGSYRD